MSEPSASPRSLQLSSFQRTLHLSFDDISLLDSALTHRSFINETRQTPVVAHNERLEFLGDAVVGQSVASLLYRRLPESSEGELAKIKSVVVSERTLARAAADIGVPAVLRLGRGEERSGGRNKSALLADALEAIVGALFLDKGYEAAAAFVEGLLAARVEQAIEGEGRDYKTLLQEYAQKYYGALPVYTLEKTEGPQHERVFWMNCGLADAIYGPFSGKTKKQAEQNAAAKVCEALAAASPLAARRLASIVDGIPVAGAPK